MLRDYHAHYTGSLPPSYIWDTIRVRRLELGKHKFTWQRFFPELSYAKCLDACGPQDEDMFRTFQYRITSGFKKYGLALEKLADFHSLYSLIQHLTKSNSLKESQHLYNTGAYSIAKSFFNEGVKEFTVLAGPRLNLLISKLRFESMAKGFARFEQEYDYQIVGYIRIVFIRGRDGKYFNGSIQYSV